MSLRWDIKKPDDLNQCLKKCYLLLVTVQSDSDPLEWWCINFSHALVTSMDYSLGASSRSLFYCIFIWRHSSNPSHVHKWLAEVWCFCYWAIRYYYRLGVMYLLWTWWNLHGKFRLILVSGLEGLDLCESNFFFSFSSSTWWHRSWCLTILVQEQGDAEEKSCTVLCQFDLTTGLQCLAPWFSSDLVVDSPVLVVLSPLIVLLIFLTKVPGFMSFHWPHDTSKLYQQSCFLILF